MSTYSRFFTMCVFSLVFRALPEIPPFFAIDTTGCDALISGKYPQAAESLRRESIISDSAFWYFKKGMALFNIQEYDNAAACFSFCIPLDPRLAPFSIECLGDIDRARNRPREAVVAYLRADSDSLLPSHRALLRSKISAVITSVPALADTIPFLKAWQTDTAATKRAAQPAAEKCPALDSLAQSTSRQHVDSVLACYTDTVDSSGASGLFARIDGLSVPDTLLSTGRLFRISQIGLLGKSYERADAWLKKAMARPDYQKAVPKKRSLYQQGILEYGCGRYASAATLLARYKSTYGPLPDVVLAIARSYRNLGKEDQAREWYRLFSRLYPKDPNAHNVVWYMAWEYEQKGHYEKAVSQYRKISAVKKNKAHASEAMFRAGLCYFKAERYAKACSVFTSCITLYPESPVVTAAQFWKAKSLLSQDDTVRARKQFAEIVRQVPTDYYAFRSREVLALSGDTSSFPAFDTTRDIIRARQWLDSISSATQDSLTPADSAAFDLGIKLAFSGLTDLAEIYLEPLETRYPQNLRLQFDLAVLYNTVNDPTASFRVARRFAWRIPAHGRSATPLSIYSLSYPFAFLDKTRYQTVSDSVDPLFVLAVMRQESTFNPTIVSRAGAVGLMQLMPATAKAVASELSEPFSPDSLTRFTANIRWGSYYLKKLLHQLDGNMVLAIAAYNAGPPMARTWMDRNKNKTMDLFVEDIGYDETRGYVKKVLGNYWTYRILARFVGFKG